MTKAIYNLSIANNTTNKHTEVTMNKLSILFAVVLLGCSKPKEPTPTPTPSTFKEDINVRWETSGKSGVKMVSLNDQKMIIGSSYLLKPNDKIKYIIEATGTKVVFRVFNNRTKEVIFADSSDGTFGGTFIY
jgi:hypothetical protein